MSGYGGGHGPREPERSPERERYIQLREIAKEQGLLDKLRDVEIPGPVKSAFGALTEVFQREEAAVAGVVDVLQGTADQGENVGGRVLREILGETKLGNTLGIKAPTGELWGDVLEQGGVGEGGRLSDLIGDDWKVTKYFDPSMRDAAVLGLSIFASPSTYLTMGMAGKSAKWVGRAGDVQRVNEKAVKFSEKVFQKQLVREAKALGLGADVGKLPWHKLEMKVISQKFRRTGIKSLDDYNEGP